jgi:hypothetical protein
VGKKESKATIQNREKGKKTSTQREKANIK